MRKRILKNNKGASALTALIIFLVLFIVFAVLFEIYMLYTVSSKVRESVERSIKNITTLNEVSIYDNLRENNFQLSDADIANLITVDELRRQISDELGLTENEDALYKMSGQGGYNYKISNLNIQSIYYDDTNTLCFEADGRIEVPIIAFSELTPDISINFDVRSMYSSKLRSTESLS